MYFPVEMLVTLGNFDLARAVRALVKNLALNINESIKVAGAGAGTGTSGIRDDFEIWVATTFICTHTCEPRLLVATRDC